MVNVDEIFQCIAKDLRGYSGKDPGAAAEEFLLGCVFDLHAAITDDVATTEKNFISKYGKGHSYSFALQDYEHGKRLASQMFWVLLGTAPDMEGASGLRFEKADQLFLFVHLRDIIPAPIARAEN